MEKVRPWCGQPSDRGRLKNRTEVRGWAQGTMCEAWIGAVCLRRRGVTGVEE